MGDVNRVALLWDLNTCPPLNSELPNLVTNVNATLAAVGCCLSNVRVIVGDNINQKFSIAEKTLLEGQGFTFVHTSERLPACEYHNGNKPVLPAPQLVLETELLKLSANHQDPLRPRSILLITGDYGFFRSMNNFRTRGYAIYLAEAEDTDPALRTTATRAWTWIRIQRGQA
ncbi:unnamed protein product [Arabis nemorensis]|uniref:NYN domain-containing protein n=1 Tax=Arabis nemorensis TaxID=586526 RepID=A0A565BVJ7_9BRAS|nr:unnamed protein product [Arabis nemorensis]